MHTEKLLNQPNLAQALNLAEHAWRLTYATFLCLPLCLHLGSQVLTAGIPWSRHERRKARRQRRAVSPSTISAVQARARHRQHLRIMVRSHRFNHHQASTQIRNPDLPNSLVPNRHLSRICRRSSLRPPPRLKMVTRSRQFQQRSTCQTCAAK